MENKIPLPTDSIYKFYALFGLLIFIFCLGSSLYITRSTNELIFASTIEYETLKSTTKPTAIEATKQKVIEKKVELALSDKKFFMAVLGFVAGFGVISMFYGFVKWHREIQPIQDETARLQLEKLRHEVKSLNSNPEGQNSVPAESNQ
ncbi:hypothetical protein NH8B_2107 [Pseudogulbenkiania sp. NH8B]|uniref:hypothetical protein n=1 Tax=Pseudogulbenkiania sp. (strain NH8B) TaxID=748280 RepID=UPI0002279B58|nr:hypothetical protein [Pseudogulbenkiania sp. NH8B]BAK76493.1 hypothetical protein NH8B_1676 [Pseudogulbenkiania sp. NH8B]BAK76922.1 hypothetical protein NH8B_2107 [Pseudogulbenkiania sp. NH8B]